MTLKDLIKKKNERLLSVPESLLSVVEKTQKKIFSELLALLDKLEKTGGSVAITGDNLSAVAEIIDELKNVLLDSDYTQAVKEYAKEFDTQKTINNDFFDKAFGELPDTSVADELVKKSKTEAVTALLDSPLDENFLKPLENILTDAVATGSSWRETLDAIQNFTTGDDEKDGKLLQYSKQIAHDDFAFADRSYTNAVADELENEWFFYSGGEIATTRCFCKERHEKYFHYKEIEAWGRGENLGDCKSGDLWAGAVPNTNAQTIFIYAGGFNCSHSIMPVSVFDVPKDVIERNIANGNYVPSAAEAEMLGV